MLFTKQENSGVAVKLEYENDIDCFYFIADYFWLQYHISC